MLSVAVVVPEMLPVPPVRGGAVENWVYDVFSRVKDHDASVTIVSRPAGVPIDDGIEYVGIPWLKAESAFHALKERCTKRNPLRHLAKILNVCIYGMRVRRKLAGKAFDVINIQNEPNLLLFLRRKPGQKLVLHMHNAHLCAPVLRTLYRRLLHGVDEVVCVSEYIKSTSVAHFPEHSHKFSVVLNGTDPVLFGVRHAVRPDKFGMDHAFHEIFQDEHARYLLYVGRLVEIKGVHVLIEAFKRLRASDPGMKLVIAGSSFFAGAATTEYQRELMRLAEPVRDAIVFTGFVPHERLKHLYWRADVTVVPSIWQDPCPLVVLEAMASGSCVVATKVGGIPELISDGQTGVLVEPDNSNAIADAVAGILSDPARKARIESSARAAVTGFYNLDRVSGQIRQRLESPTDCRRTC